MKRAAPATLLVGGLLVVGGLALALAPPHVEESVNVTTTIPSAPSVAAHEPPAPADPNDLGIEDPRAVSPSKVIGRAKARALQWDNEAVIASIQASNVRGSTLDLTTSGRLVLEFGKLTGAGFGTGAPLGEQRFFVTLGADGNRLEQRVGNAGTLAALEPNCSFEDAVRVVRASGIGATPILTLTYAISTRHEKAVWTAIAANDTQRVVDGWSCAILVQHPPNW